METFASHLIYAGVVLRKKAEKELLAEKKKRDVFFEEKNFYNGRERDFWEKRAEKNVGEKRIYRETERFLREMRLGESE